MFWIGFPLAGARTLLKHFGESDPPSALLYLAMGFVLPPVILHPNGVLLSAAWGKGGVPAEMHVVGRHLHQLFLYYLLVGVAVFGMMLYMLKLYPATPQAFGGIAPRVGQLDLNPAQAGSQTVRQLSASPQMEGAVVRIVPLEVMYVGSDRVVVRCPGTDSPMTIIELDRASVHAIIWPAK